MYMADVLGSALPRIRTILASEFQGNHMADVHVLVYI